MRKWLIALIVLLVISLIFLTAGAIGAGFLRSMRPIGSYPVVDILSPSGSEALRTGSPVQIQAVARDPDGITRMEFWLDQQLLRVQESPLSDGITPYSLAYAVSVSDSGPHAVIVRAFDSTGLQGQASITFNFDAGPQQGDPKTYLIAEGDSTASIAAAHGLSEADLIDAFPDGSDDLPPVGTEILISPPPEDQEREPEPVDEPGDLPVEYMPEFASAPVDLMPPWYTSVTGLFNQPLTPIGLLNLATLEVDRPYDGVYCYISAGESPVIRSPGSGSYAHLDGNYWDIAEWFYGDRALSFIAGSGDLRVRMNCMGYTIGTAGGMAFNLGTLDITRAPTDYTSAWVDEKVIGPDGWFRIRFMAGGSEPGYGGGGPEDIFLSLGWARYGWNDNPFSPNPHVVLNIGFYETSTCGPGCESPRVPPPLVDGFLLYRNGELWRTIVDPMAESYILWDSLWEAGSCHEETRFNLSGYIGAPGDPDRTITSNPIVIPGFCPTRYKYVAVKFTSIRYDCLRVDVPFRTSLDTRGGACNLIPEDWGPGVYGGVNVNGVRTFDIFYPVYSGLFLAFPYGTYIPMREVILTPEESLTISSTMWDYDVWSDSDPFCWDEVVYGPAELEAMTGRITHFDQEFSDLEMEPDYVDPWGGTCTISYDVTVKDVAGPPVPVIIP